MAQESLIGIPQDSAALVVDGQQALALRLALIRSARHSLVAQYYSWEEDLSGKLLLGALIEAARRGVKVRLLVDDLYSGHNRYLESLAAEPNIKVRIFNPFWLRLGRPWLWPLEIVLSFRRLNHRMHNKLLVVDDNWAMVGGRNIGDGYFALPGAEHHFVDLDLLLQGPVCGELVKGFIAYWRGRWSHVGHRLSWFRVPTAIAEQNNDFLLALLEPEVAELFGLGAHLFEACMGQLHWHPVRTRVVMDPPGKGLKLRWHPSAATRSLLSCMKGLHHSLQIVTPYLVPTRPLYRALRRLKRQGVAITVVTNSLASTDMALAYAGYCHRQKRLLQQGAVHELKPQGVRALHAKVALLDERAVLVGSLNLDPRSFYLNTEIALLLEGEALAGEVGHWLASLCSQSQSWPLTLQQGVVQWGEASAPPATSVWRRCWVWLAGCLPVHHLL